MAILIVDDEAKTREALRSLLCKLGHRVILEAKNGEEALRISDCEKSRIDMIIADLEMPYMDGLVLAEKTAERPILDLAPFLLITSDLSRSQLIEYQKRIPRLDCCLVKPFRMTTLAQAMTEAYLQRCSTRNRILYLGTQAPAALQEALQASSFKLIEKVRSIHEWEEFLSQKKADLGAVMIDPGSLNEEQRAQFNSVFSGFKKTPLGTVIPFVCLSVDPNETFYFRTTCQMFHKRGETQEEWTNLIDKMQARVATGWDMELLFQEAKVLIQQRKLNIAWKLAEKMLKLDAHQSDVHVTAGDILEGLSRTKDAIQHYQKAIELNPTLPRPYIRLLKLLDVRRNESPPLAKVIELGTQFCPQNSDLLLTTAEFYIKTEEYEKSRKLLEAVLKLNSGHETAQQLLNSLPC